MRLLDAWDESINRKYRQSRSDHNSRDPANFIYLFIECIQSNFIYLFIQCIQSKDYDTM